MKKPWRPDPNTPDNEWPIGMHPDGTLNIVTPPGLTDEEISEWIEDQEDAAFDEPDETRELSFLKPVFSDALEEAIAKQEEADAV